MKVNSSNIPVNINIIPQPQFLKMYGGILPIPSVLTLFGDHFFQQELELFSAMIDVPVIRGLQADECWVRCLRADFGSKENYDYYSLEVCSDGIEIKAETQCGMFYGLQTLRQVIKDSIKVIPLMKIEDFSLFCWRGLLIDEARHFQGIAQIKQILDWMAALKLNVLHWHLTDCQGWRIEIKAFPTLTAIGSRRTRSQLSGFGVPKKNYREEAHTGFYTQDEMKEIIQYASKRHIHIVPEVDFPGHFMAAIAAYPYLGCRKEAVDVTGEFGILPYNACVGDDRTLDFLRKVLDELCELFPSDVIHIGGDEVDPKDWKECPLCRSKMQTLGFKDIHALQDWVMNEMGRYLGQKGKKAFVWDDADHGLLQKELGLVYWLGKKRKHVDRIQKKILKGREVIFQPFWSTYFDWPYALVPLRATYHFNPLQGIPNSAQMCVLGVQGALWTEFIDSGERLQWCLFPRMAALAEMAWTTREIKNFSNFCDRWERWKGMRDELGINADAPVSVANPYSPLQRIWVLMKSIFGSMWYEQEHLQAKTNSAMKRKQFH